MKNKLILFLIITILCINGNAQTPQLWGMTSYGGANNMGAIIKINADGTGLDVPYSFGSIPNLSSGSHPRNDLFQAADGKLYGMTYDGGLYNKGTIFSFDVNTNTFTRLYSFGDIDGANPVGSLVQADNGKLYGMTSAGGANNQGALFCYNISTDTYSNIYDFSSLYTPSVLGSLIKAYNGKLYGMTEYGGPQGYGTIFSIDPATDTYTLLKNLNSGDGDPIGSFYQASDSNLYGGCYGGVFKYEIANNLLYILNSSYAPSADFVQINNFLLFSFNHNDGIYGFNLTNDSSDMIYQMPDTLINSHYYYPKGDGLNGSPLFASDGKLYGLASDGGKFNYGTIFNYNPSNNTVTKLYDFNDTLGAQPLGSVIQASNGKLYGMTYVGGSSNAGVIFSYDPVNDSYNKLYDFFGFYSADGSSPYGNLLHASNGLLYGMTSAGGNNNVGSLFSFDANTNNFSKLYNFTLAQGAQPEGSLIQASDGNLYGLTLLGGTDTNHYAAQESFQAYSPYIYPIAGSGVIFKYEIATNTYTILHYFNDSTGAVPYGNLMQSVNGKLYGMATYGGICNYGVIFSYDINTNSYTIIHSFNDTAGSNPYGSLIEGTDGKLYGMTLNGGVYAPAEGRCGDFGVIFSFDTTTNNFSVLQYFNYAANSGQRPFGSLLHASNGKLYGMTSGSSAGIYNVDNCTFGSSSNIFSLDISTNTFSDLHDFNYSYGGLNPVGSILQSSNGNMYGMTQYGGPNGTGVIFSMDTSSTGNYIEIHNFYGFNGAYPYGDFIELSEGTGINKINKNTEIISAYPNPFNDFTVISIKGNNPNSNSYINLYDISGREVRSVFVGDKKEIILNRDLLESGMYFYKLLSNEKKITASGKLIIY